MKNIYILFISIVFSISSWGQNTKIQKIEFKNPYKFNFEIEEKVETSTKSWKYQKSATEYAAKGDYKNTLLHWDLAFGTNEKNYTAIQIDSINALYKKVNAIDYIIKQSKNNQVIIINEAHHNPFHRIFTKSLLQDLYNNGYTNLGLEAITNEDGYIDTLLNKRNYPIQNTGYYISEPQFGNLVRTALEIGYTVFGYEESSKIKDIHRDVQQARNIQKEIAKRPNEKFLIHCGFGHAIEGIHTTWGKAMAGRLTECTGINPLTINQSAYNEKADPKFNSPFLKALDIKKSAIIVDKDGNPFRYEEGEGWSDIAIFHPNTKYINNRPNWLFENGNQNVSIALTDIGIDFPVMVLAFKKGENINKAIPIDIIEIADKSKSSLLTLKKGDYIIIVVNQKGDAVKFDQRVK